MKLKATINYGRIEDAHRSGQKGIILPGGTRSSKTISALQWILVYCMRNTGKEIAICRDSMTNLRRTVLKDFEALCYGYKGYPAMHPRLHINKSDWTCKINGNMITFFGLNDDSMRVYGFATDIFFINEAISTYRNTFDQLEQRCNEFWLADCNPSEPNSWVYQLPLRDDVTEFRSTYKDNPFLPKTIISKIESYEPTEHNIAQGTADARKWCIYGQGQIYKGKEIIYPDWDLFDEDPTEFDYAFYGLDWGFNDPLACIKIWVAGNDLYAREIIYASGIEKMEDIIMMLKDQQDLREHKTYLVCDTNEPRSILTLQREGLPAMKAKKTGGILDGIRKVNSYRIHVHKDSKNIQNEFNNYKFKVDSKTETIIDVPVDKDNHACDAIRYPLITFL